jgi:hypothetical protein
MLVVADLGCLKAYRITTDESSSSPRLDLIEAFYNTNAQTKLTDKVTDEAGRFEGGNPMSQAGGGNGERHNIQLEINKRAIRDFARKIELWVKHELTRDGEEPGDIYFAASKAIHKQILNHLEPHARVRVVKNIAEDLTKVHKSQLLGHFAQAEAA